MTWDEFKSIVDEKLKKDHADQRVEIWYIDITFPLDDSLKITVDGGQLRITD